MEIVQLNLGSSAPLPPPPATPDSFFDIFVDIDIDSESLLFDFQTQVFDLDIPPPFEPPLWQLWFEDLQWLDEFGRPVPGRIIGFWLLGMENGNEHMVFPPDIGIPGIFDVFYGPNSIHVENFDPFQTALYLQSEGFDGLKIQLHTEHIPIPEPKGMALLTIAGLLLLFRHPRRLLASRS